MSISKIGYHNRLNSLFRSINSDYVYIAPIIDKFLFLWTGKYDGDDLLSDLDASVITVTGKDFATRTIPETSLATFAVPDNATYLGADGADDFWYDALNALQQKTFADLIASTTLRTFIRYTDFEPYEVSAIGILKEGEVLTEADKIALNKYFKLWAEYWGVLMDSGYRKDNRTFLPEMAKYGLLYNWYAVSDARGLAPEGWHIPTFSEWGVLQSYLDPDTVNYRSAIAGGKMKVTGTEYWNSPNTGADNSSGFSSVGTGRRDKNFLYPFDTRFRLIKTYNDFSCYDQRSEEHINVFTVFSSSARFDWSDTNNPKFLGVPVRCIRDTNVGWVEGEQVTDIDGHVYDTVQIGTQIWLKQNLAVTHYKNGESIPEITDGDTWSNLTTGALCAYNNDWSNVFK